MVCRIPETTLSFFSLGSVKIGPGWCRWVKITERSIPTGSFEFEGDEEKISESKVVLADHTVSIKKREYIDYTYYMGKGDVLKGEIDSDAPINVYFMNGTNFDKYHRDKNI